MRIGKPESDEKGFVRFEDVGIGCCFREYDDWDSDEPVYMKTNCFSVDIGSTNDSYSFRTGSTPVSGSIAYCIRKFLHLSLSAVCSKLCP